MSSDFCLKVFVLAIFLLSFNNKVRTLADISFSEFNLIQI